jgi:hypothetical protein
MQTEIITSDIVDIQYPYNAIFGRNIINKFAATIYQPYLCMKIPTAEGVLSIFGIRRRPEGAKITRLRLQKKYPCH